MDWLPVVTSAVLATIGVIGALAAYHKWYGSKIVSSASADKQRQEIAAELYKVTVWFDPPGPGLPDFTIPAQLREIRDDVADQASRLKTHLDEESVLGAAALEREKERDRRIDLLFSKLADPTRGK